MSNNRAGPVLSRTGVRSMMTVKYLSPTPGAPPDMLSDADYGHPSEPGRVLDHGPLALGNDRAVSSMPRHAQAFGDVRTVRC
jgi:hypothetical protein